MRATGFSKHEKELKKRVQAEYDATAPVQDIRAQLAGTAESVGSYSAYPEPPSYAFTEQSCIATAFFDPPSATNVDGDWPSTVAFLLTNPPSDVP